MPLSKTQVAPPPATPADVPALTMHAPAIYFGKDISGESSTDDVTSVQTSMFYGNVPASKTTPQPPRTPTAAAMAPPIKARATPAIVMPTASYGSVQSPSVYSNVQSPSMYGNVQTPGIYGNVSTAKVRTPSLQSPSLYENIPLRTESPLTAKKTLVPVLNPSLDHDYVNLPVKSPPVVGAQGSQQTSSSLV